MYIVGYKIVFVTHASDFVLPNVSVEICETVGDEEEVGWQPISAISLQQSFQI